MGSCDLELSVASASWSIVTLFRGRRVTEARYERAGMMVAEADRRVEGGPLRVGVMVDKSGERWRSRGCRYTRRVWYSLLADGDGLAITALDHFNCAALLTMRPHCAFAISIGVC